MPKHPLSTLLTLAEDVACLNNSGVSLTQPKRVTQLQKRHWQHNILVLNLPCEINPGHSDYSDFGYTIAALNSRLPNSGSHSDRNIGENKMCPPCSNYAFRGDAVSGISSRLGKSFITGGTCKNIL